MKLSDITCYFCGIKMTQQGGILFSPPSDMHKSMVYKHHVCRGCYSVIVARPREIEDQK